MSPTRRLLPTGLAAVALAAAGCGGSSGDNASTSQGAAPATAGGGVRIEMKDIKFNPADVRVRVGQKITWTNGESVPHDVVAKEGADFKSDAFSKGGTFSYTPTRPGTIKYVCSLHPGMDGTIEVAGS